MKKQYTKKQIQEAIDYWKNQLDEGLFDGNSVKKFMKELQAALQKSQAVLLGASKKDGKTYVIAQYECENNKLTLYLNGKYLTDDQPCLDAKTLIEGLLKDGIKAKQIDSVAIEFQDGSVYDLSDVAVMEITSKVYGRGKVVILAVNPNTVAVDRFFD